MPLTNFYPTVLTVVSGSGASQKMLCRQSRKPLRELRSITLSTTKQRASRSLLTLRRCANDARLSFGCAKNLAEIGTVIRVTALKYWNY